jgi:C-terminal processing protease CtpA/Prc
VDWAAQRRIHRDAAAQAPTVDSLVQVLRAMVAPLNDGHISFTSPAGQFVGASTPRGQPNWDTRRWSAVVNAAGWTQVKANLGYARFRDIAYVAIGSWNSSQFDASDLDGILDRVREARALILDVRANGGGNDALAFTFAGRFSSSSIPAGSVRYRSGAGLGTPTTRTVPPRGPWTWDSPVVLLIGRQCYSSNESFIAAMGTLPHVTTMGDTTGGGSGNPETRTLGGGWTYRLPRWIEYGPDGRVIEWNGIAPRVHVPFDTAGRPLSQDPVIEAALARLGRSS